MENKEFVPYEQALALKELGFDEPCLFYYYGSKNLESIISINIPKFINHNKSIFKTCCSAPTYSQVFRWFREKHRLFSTIEVDQTMEPKFCYSISGYEPIGNWENIVYGSEVGLYYTYEEAELECLKKLIKIIKYPVHYFNKNDK